MSSRQSNWTARRQERPTRFANAEVVIGAGRRLIEVSDALWVWGAVEPVGVEALECRRVSTPSRASGGAGTGERARRRVVRHHRQDFDAHEARERQHFMAVGVMRPSHQMRLDRFVELARVYRGWNRAQLADRLGRDPSHIVPAAGNAKLSFLRRVAEALDWDVRDVVDAVAHADELELDALASVRRPRRGERVQRPVARSGRWIELGWDGAPAGDGASTAERSAASRSRASPEPRSNAEGRSRRPDISEFERIDREAIVAHRNGDIEPLLDAIDRLRAVATTPTERAIVANREVGAWDLRGRSMQALEAAHRGLAEESVDPMVRLMLQANLAHAHLTVWHLVEAQSVASDVLERTASMLGDHHGGQEGRAVPHSTLGSGGVASEWEAVSRSGTALGSMQGQAWPDPGDDGIRSAVERTPAPPVARYDRRLVEIVRAFAWFVRGSALCRALDFERWPGRHPLAERARTDVRAARDAYRRLAAESGERHLAALAHSCEAIGLECDAALDLLDPGQAVRIVLERLEDASDLDSVPGGDWLESYGWWAITGCTVALRHLEGHELHRTMAICTNKALEIADRLDHWAMRERAFTMERCRRQCVEDATGCEPEWLLDTEDVRVLAGTMGRFPSFRPVGWRILESANLFLDVGDEADLDDTVEDDGSATTTAPVARARASRAPTPPAMRGGARHPDTPQAVVAPVPTQSLCSGSALAAARVPTPRSTAARRAALPSGSVSPSASGSASASTSASASASARASPSTPRIDARSGSTAPAAAALTAGRRSGEAASRSTLACSSEALTPSECPRDAPRRRGPTKASDSSADAPQSSGSPRSPKAMRPSSAPDLASGAAGDRPAPAPPP